MGDEQGEDEVPRLGLGMILVDFQINVGKPNRVFLIDFLPRAPHSS